ncbi:MAG: hypothetical protein RLZZ253_3292 [Verrucomicrobiota bacterium]|jgi:hypothetical protein
MNPNEDPELWNLLGKARDPKVSPYFARNVLRALRSELEHPAPQSLWERIQVWVSLPNRRVSLGVAGLMAALCLSSVLLLPSTRETRRQDHINQIAQVIAASPDYGVISQLDELLASEEGNLWIEGSPL